MAGIFKAYDIRALVEPNGLTEERVYLVGRGLAQEIFQEKSPILVSRDMRTHSPALCKALINGLMDGGCDVLDIGLSSTPMHYWANNVNNVAGSVQVTASHNGPKYNGIKVSGPEAIPYDYSTGLNVVESYVNHHEKEGTKPEPAHTKGTYTEIEGSLPKYLEWMVTFLPQEAPADGRKVKIVVDTGNGMAGSFIGQFLQHYPWIEPVALYWELDGNFPNHEADPLKFENLVDLQKKVIETKADFGVAFDGDADRCVFVDELGQVVTSDFTTALIAETILQEHPGAPILYDGRSSAVVPEHIRDLGGIAVRGKVGHSFMKRLLRERQGKFGGELSGHFYFEAHYNTDSGLLAMIEMLKIWLKHNKPMSEIVKPLRKYCSTGELNFKVPDVHAVMVRLEEHYKGQDAVIDHFDGLTVRLPEWWFNVRASNTEPLLRLNLETKTDIEKEQRLVEVSSLIQEAKLPV